jgi:hypothetical protein
MFQVSGVGPMFGQEAHFTHYAKDRHDYAIERYSREVDRLMMVIDKRLGEAAWLAGDDYSIADMATLPYLRRQLIEKAGRFPNVDRWGAYKMYQANPNAWVPPSEAQVVGFKLQNARDAQEQIDALYEQTVFKFGRALTLAPGVRYERWSDRDTAAASADRDAARDVLELAE